MLAEVCRERDAVFQVTPNPQNALVVPADPRDVGRPLPAAAARDGALGARHVRPPAAVAAVPGRDLRRQSPARRQPALPDPRRAVRHPRRRADHAAVRGVRAPGWSSTAAPTATRGARSGRATDFATRFRADWDRRELRTFHRDPARMRIVASPDAAHVGRTFAEVAAARGGDADRHGLIDLLATHDDALRWVACGANERADVRARLMAHPHILPGFTDAGAHSRNLAFFDGALALLRQAVDHGVHDAGARDRARHRRGSALVQPRRGRIARRPPRRHRRARSRGAAGADSGADRARRSAARRRAAHGQARLGGGGGERAGARHRGGPRRRAAAGARHRAGRYAPRADGQRARPRRGAGAPPQPHRRCAGRPSVPRLLGHLRLQAPDARQRAHALRRGGDDVRAAGSPRLPPGIPGGCCWCRSRRRPGSPVTRSSSPTTSTRATWCSRGAPRAASIACSSRC